MIDNKYLFHVDKDETLGVTFVAMCKHIIKREYDKTMDITVVYHNIHFKNKHNLN